MDLTVLFTSGVATVSLWALPLWGHGVLVGPCPDALSVAAPAVKVKVVRVELRKCLQTIDVIDRQILPVTVIRPSLRNCCSMRLTCTVEIPSVSASSVWVTGSS
jgi:hypothetical protein